MSIFYSSENIEKSIGLAEFIEVCDSLLPLDTDTKLKKVIPYFRMLANNSDLLPDALLQEIEKSTPLFERPNSSTNIQSILLESNSNYSIRMNFWPTKNEYDLSKNSLNTYFAYNYAHDHNFDFLTVGYFGPGYTTKVYEYNYDKVKSGSQCGIGLDFIGNYALGKGDVMLYKKNLHIHEQFAPSSFSASLNLIPNRPIDSPQFEFDLKQAKVSSLVEAGSPKSVLLSIASFYDDLNLFSALARFE